VSGESFGIPVTNDETTGATGVCVHCGKQIEEGLLMKGLRIGGRVSTGVPTWRSVDRGWGSARCAEAVGKAHAPA
jgi:hypothetical protein